MMEERSWMEELQKYILLEYAEVHIGTAIYMIQILYYT